MDVNFLFLLHEPTGQRKDGGSWRIANTWQWRLLFGKFVKTSFKSDNPPPDSTHENDQLSPMYANPGFKPFSILCSPTCCNQLNLILVRDLLSYLCFFWAISNYFPQIIPGHPTFATVGLKENQSTIMNLISKAANLLRIWKEIIQWKIALFWWIDQIVWVEYWRWSMRERICSLMDRSN